MFLAVLPFAMACSSSTTSSSSSSDAGGTTNAASVDLGKTIATKNACASCHGADYAGSASGIPGNPNVNAPNVTSDEQTGVGGWSDEQLAAAIRTGVDDEGKSLCSVMPKFGSLSDADVANLVAYLRSVPAVSKDIPATDCPAVK
ncbi:Putative diheme cytochrome c-553 [Labilithrix luteola]|uniref:Putative diheme cytochrome c-553 n=1 Tax=Labilithrix luteola TaxID=1391654 RepID=A0A0K1PYD7_9BACT|nr:Putative diheme cytochrome c-553 [Labilithrix luteola]